MQHKELMCSGKRTANSRSTPCLPTSRQKRHGDGSQANPICVDALEEDEKHDSIKVSAGVSQFVCFKD